MTQNNDITLRLRVEGADAVKAATQQTAQGLERMGESSRRGTTAAAQGVRSISEQLQQLQQLGGTALGLGAMIAAAQGLARSVIESATSLQKLRSSLEYSTGSVKNAAAEIVYLSRVSQTLGLDFGTASQAYAKFAASSVAAGISLETTRAAFEGVSKAGARFGLNAEEMNGALLALSQIASKGVVSAEELRGQLGERLPGAFAMAAKAMNVTQAELGKMLETGQVLSSEFLPKFAEELNKIQAPAGTLAQEINRLNSAWTQWKQELTGGTSGSGFEFLTRSLNESRAAMKALGDEAGVTYKILVGIGGAIAGTFGSTKFNLDARQDQLKNELSAARRLKEQYDALEKSRGGYLTPMERQDRNQYAREEQAAKNELMRLADIQGRRTGLTLPNLKEQFEAQNLKKDDALRGYLSGSGASKAAKLAADVEKENKAFKAAVSDLQETDQRYQDALKEHQTRIAEINERAKDKGAASKAESAAKAAAREALQVLEAGLQGEIAAVGRAEKDKLDLIQHALDLGQISVADAAAQRVSAISDGADAEIKALNQLAVAQAKAGNIDDYIKTVGKINQVVDQSRGLYREAAQAVELYNKKLTGQNVADLQKQVQSVAELAESRQKSNADLREELALMGKTPAEIAEYNRAKLEQAAVSDEVAARQAEERAVFLETLEELPTLAAEYRRLAEAKRASAGQLREQSGLQGAVQEARAATEAWKDFSRDIERSLTDSLMRSFESGQSAGKTFAKSLQATFKSMVLKVAVQAIVSPVMGALQGALTLGGGAVGAAGAAQGASSLGNLVSGGSSLYNAFSGGGTLSAGYSALAGSSIGQAIGLSTAVTEGAIASHIAGQLAANGAALTAESSIIAAQAMTQMAGSSTVVGSSLTTLGSTIGAALPWVAGALALATALGAFDHKGGPKTRLTGEGALVAGQWQAGSLTSEFNDRSGKTKRTFMDEMTQALFNDSLINQVKRFAPAYSAQSNIRSMLDPQGESKNQNTIMVGRASGEQIYRASKETGKGAKDFQAWLNEQMPRAQLAVLSDAMRTAGNDYQAIAEAFVGTSTDMTTALEKLDATAAGQLLGNLTGMADLFDAIKDKINPSVTGEAVVALNQLSGGLQALSQNVTGYYQGYFSAEEQMNHLRSQVTESFADLGLAMPDTRDGFRSLVESLELTTEAGQRSFAGLMAVQGAFGQVADAAAEAAQKLADAAAEAAQKLADAAAEDAQKLAEDKAEELKRRQDIGKASFNQRQDNIKQQADDIAQAAQVAADALRTLALSLLQTREIALTSASASVSQAQSDLRSAHEREARSIQSTIDQIISDNQTAWQDALSEVERSRGQLRSAYEREAGAIQELMQRFAAAAGNLKKTIATLLSGDASALDPAQKMGVERAQFTDTARRAQLGNLDALESLPELALSLSERERSQAATWVDFARANAGIAQSLSDAEGSATRGESGQQRALESLNAQVSGLIDLTEAQLSVSEALHQLSRASGTAEALSDIERGTEASRQQLTDLNRQVSRYIDIGQQQLSVDDAINALNQSQLDATYTGTEYLKAILDAINAGALTPEQARQSISASSLPKEQALATGNGGSVWASTGGAVGYQDARGSQIVGVTQNSFSFDEARAWVRSQSDASNLRAIYDRARSEGISANSLDQLMGWSSGTANAWAKKNGLPQFALGGSHLGGLRIVGENGPELEATGPSRIYSASQTRDLLSGGGNQALLNEIRALRAEVAQLRAASEATARHAHNTSRQLNRWDGDGMPEVRTA